MTTDVEALYAALALHIDDVGVENTERYLAKAALALARALGDTEAALAILQDCIQDLGTGSNDPQQL